MTLAQGSGQSPRSMPGRPEVYARSIGSPDCRMPQGLVQYDPGVRPNAELLEAAVPRDLPGRYDRHEQPEHGSSGGLADRLGQLPASHPSSPGYRGADAGATQPGAAELPTAGSGLAAGRGRDGQRAGSRDDPA